MDNKKQCHNCGAHYEIEHDLPEEDYIEKYCPFCGDDLPEEDEFNVLEEDDDEW